MSEEHHLPKRPKGNSSGRAKAVDRDESGIIPKSRRKWTLFLLVNVLIIGCLVLGSSMLYAITYHAKEWHLFVHDNAILNFMGSTLGLALPGSMIVPRTQDPISVSTIHPHFIPSLRLLNAKLLPVHYTDHLYRDVLAQPRTCKLSSHNRIPVGALTSRLENLYESYLTRIPQSAGITGSFLVLPKRHSDVYEHLYRERVRAAAADGQHEATVFPLFPREHHAYIMTLGVLPEYRRLGIGSRLVQSLIAEANLINEETFVRIRERKAGNFGPAASRGIPEDAVITCLSLHVQENNTAGMQFYERQGFEKLHFVKNYYTRITPRGAFLMIRKLPFEHYLKDLY